MSKPPVSNLGFHPQNVDHCPFQHLFQFCHSQSDRSLLLWCVPTTKGSADATLFTPLGPTVHCALDLSPFTSGTFPKQNIHTCYRDRKVRKWECSHFLQGNTWHLVGQTLCSASQSLPSLSQEHLQKQSKIHKHGQKTSQLVARLCIKMLICDKAHLQHLCWQSTHQCCRLWQMSGKPVQCCCRSNETLRIEKLAADYYRFCGH